MTLKNQNEEIVVVAGPCAVESEKQVQGTAQSVQRMEI